MQLYAGITYFNIFSFKYSHQIIYLLKVTVTKLKQLSQSAGNYLNFFIIVGNRTSETTRCKSEELNNNKIKKISVHVPKHIKPRNNEDLGHYLAGLIDGGAHFTSKLVIKFNILDASLAYYIKKKLGYGNVYKVKNKKAVVLVVTNYTGINIVLKLINGKIRSKTILNQINQNIFSNPLYKNLPLFRMNISSDLNNYWLAGFSDADASFQIDILEKKDHSEVCLNFKIDQKDYNLLNLIKNFLGGNISYNKSQDVYYYSSASLGSAHKVINYFDRFHLLSNKHVNFLKWRKTYILIQDEKYLTKEGLEQIIRIKTKMIKGETPSTYDCKIISD